MKPSIPLGVRIIALLNYIIAVVGPLWLIYAFFFAAPVTMVGAFISLFPILLVSILCFIAAKDLNNGDSTGRFITIGLNVVTVFIVQGAVSTNTLIQILPSILIVMYLLFDKKVKAAFIKKNSTIVPISPTSTL
jgi:hypothetical protein